MNNFKVSMNNIWNSVRYTCKKNSPTIKLVSGCVMVLGGTVLACKATLKSKDKIDILKKDVEEIRKENSEDVDKKVTKAYAKTAVKVAKDFAHAIAAEVTGIGLIASSHKEMKNHNAELGATLAGVMSEFNTYRQEVKKEFGEETDLKMMGVSKKEMETASKDSDGNDIYEFGEVNVSDGSNGSFVRYFTKSNKLWRDEPYYLDGLFRGQIRYLSDLLIARENNAVIFNEALDAFGFQQNFDNGLIMGWRHTKTNSVNYIDVDIKKVYITAEDGISKELAYRIEFLNPQVLYVNKKRKAR